MSAKHDTRVIVYPAYVDAKKTVAEGRRIPKNLAVPDVYVDFLEEACKQLNLPVQIEGKHYPREWLPLGRIRVQLKKDDGSPVNPEIPNRQTLMIKIAELVPKHPQYGKRQGPATMAREAAAAMASGGAAGGAGASSAAKAAAPAAKGGKKKGKK